ncbi:polysaccharide deacetylase family protein [Paenibacillus validus]|nr:polysaccharide deacetylase family protein [Paenibacillus validus]
MKSKLASALSLSVLTGVGLWAAGCTSSAGSPPGREAPLTAAVPRQETLPPAEPDAAVPPSAAAALASAADTDAADAGASGDAPPAATSPPEAPAPSPGVNETAAAAAASQAAAEAAAEGREAVTAVVYAGSSANAEAEAFPAALDKKTVSMPVLNYHSIGHDPGNSLVLAPDKFAAQMSYLAEHGFTPLSLTEFILILEKKKPAPPKPVLLTFDDGYEDNFEHAMPVLQKHQFPATLFMSPGVAGQDGYLNWEQVKQMHESGWDIQPHGMTHPHLPKLSPEKQKEEITEARRLIEEKLGTKADVFCYPYGEFNKTTLSVLEEAGFRYAFTIRQGWTTSAQPPLELKRIYVNGKERLSEWVRRLSKP